MTRYTFSYMIRVLMFLLDIYIYIKDIIDTSNEQTLKKVANECLNKIQPQFNREELSDMCKIYRMLLMFVKYQTTLILHGQSPMRQIKSTKKKLTSDFSGYQTIVLNNVGFYIVYTFVSVFRRRMIFNFRAIPGSN